MLEFATGLSAGAVFNSLGKRPVTDKSAAEAKKIIKNQEMNDTSFGLNIPANNLSRERFIIRICVLKSRIYIAKYTPSIDNLKYT